MRYKLLIPITFFVSLIPISILVLGFLNDSSMNVILMTQLAMITSLLIVQFVMAENSDLDEYLPVAFVLIAHAPIWIICTVSVEVLASDIVSTEGTFVRMAACAFYAFSAVYLAIHYQKENNSVQNRVKYEVHKNEFRIKVESESEARREMREEHRLEVERLNGKIESIMEINETYKQALKDIHSMALLSGTKSEDEDLKDGITIVKRVASFD